MYNAGMRFGTSQLSSRIREEARRLGFFRTGVVPARPLPHPERFTDWLEKGMHGEMRYLERQAPKRLDPTLVLANARSILVLAMSYHAVGALTENALKGRISRFAWGNDYHTFIRNRLEQLLSFIRNQEPSAQGICYVDTGPVMEKVWGAQSALGWMGKHTNLITRDHGSWFFIGVILLNLDLDCDSPEQDYCGTCRRCIDACPTGAIIAPYVLDTRLCISYLTIELRGSIPVRLRSLIGNRIYGCDDCQDACPWNRFASRTTESAFKPLLGSFMPDLLPLVQIKPEEFKRRFKDSPVLRATRDGFVRNAVVALGNSRRNEAIPALEMALRDPSPLVGEHTEWAMRNLRMTIDD
jgi:epoxyqueuosine reductase